MKINRSTKCSLKFANQGKMQTLGEVLSEYGRVCQFFIDHFWKEGLRPKSKFFKEFVDLPLTKLEAPKGTNSGTWLSARLRKVAAREAHDMVQAMQKRWGDKAVKPRHSRRSMHISSTIATLQKSKEAHEFDFWLHLASVGNKTILDLPVRSHYHFKKLAEHDGKDSKRCNDYIVTKDYVQLAFQLDVDVVDAGEAFPDSFDKADAIGVDTGIKKLATLSDGTQLGTDVELYIQRIIACQEAGVSQTKARMALRHYMDKVAKQVVNHVRRGGTVVVEDLRNMNVNTAKEKKISKQVRKKLGAWAYSYWLKRLEMTTEERRSRFVRVSPAYTSQKCSKCDHTERSNRKGESFECLGCGYQADADHNAAINILERYRSSLPSKGG